MPRQPKALELFGQEGDIGCCQPKEEVGLMSERTVLARRVVSISLCGH